MSDDVLARATALADDVLFARALDTDDQDVLPEANLDALADLGLYGIFAPPELGGLGADLPMMCELVEIIASGCLTTALVWVQHFGLLGSLLGGPAHLRDAWLADAARGERRGGIAFGGLLPGPPVLTATAIAGDDGEPSGAWRLDGFAPFVSGWGRIDLLHVAARGPDDTVVNVAIDAVEHAELRITRQRLAAVDASNTVRADFDGLAVGTERVLSVVPYDPAGSLGTNLRLNGSLALGVTRRCTALLGPTGLDDELIERRAALDAADADTMAIERAAASELALRAAAALAVHDGSRALRRDEHAQRLLREAMFLLVFGSRQPIKESLLARLTRR
jgi:alkylation response protein AidB-like acyl-CoA dehydrogenase